LTLVIETDGATHFYENVKKKDRGKEDDLISHGYSILRFKDTEVESELEKVKEKIRTWIRNYEIEHPEVLKKKIRNKRS